LPSDQLFGPSLGSERMAEAVSDLAWVQAMLDVEAALARAEAKVGIIPAAAAGEIAAHCRAEEFDVERIGREAAESANPVVPLVKALREKVGRGAGQYLHRGATSQDILDTAMMLIARRGLAVMLEDLDQAAAAAAGLAERHRSTLMAGRTLMQQALVTTFGLKAAGWLVSIVEAQAQLSSIRDRRLALQFGGAVGTMAALGDRGPAVARELVSALRLQEPVLPWHTARSRIAELGAALAIAAGAAGKVALDVVLLAQTEVAELRPAPGPGRGASSTMPQKQNPVDAVEILAAVRGVTAQAGLLLGSLTQEHERAAGAWQAEWPALTEAFRQAGGATARVALLLRSLEVDAERMRRNLDLTGGLVMSEGLVMVLAERTDDVTARQLVEAAVANARRSGRPFQRVVEDDRAIAAHLDAKQLAQALEPSGYLGATSALIDRALGAYRAARESPGPR
jgi:3-carboxy-cis,cis-muconate cycloisomerase